MLPMFAMDAQPMHTKKAPENGFKGRTCRQRGLDELKLNPLSLELKCARLQDLTYSMGMFFQKSTLGMPPKPLPPSERVPLPPSERV